MNYQPLTVCIIIAVMKKENKYVQNVNVSRGVCIFICKFPRRPWRQHVKHIPSPAWSSAIFSTVRITVRSVCDCTSVRRARLIAVGSLRWSSPASEKKNLKKEEEEVMGEWQQTPSPSAVQRPRKDPRMLLFSSPRCGRRRRASLLLPLLSAVLLCAIPVSARLPGKSPTGHLIIRGLSLFSAVARLSVAPINATRTCHQRAFVINAGKRCATIQVWFVHTLIVGYGVRLVVYVSCCWGQVKQVRVNLNEWQEHNGKTKAKKFKCPSLSGYSGCFVLCWQLHLC